MQAQAHTHTHSLAHTHRHALSLGYSLGYCTFNSSVSANPFCTKTQMKRKETWIRSCSHLVQQKSKPLTQCKKRGARELRPLEASFNKGYGVVPCSCCLIGFVQCLFSFVSLLGLLWLHVHSFSTSKLPTVRHVTGIGTVTALLSGSSVIPRWRSWRWGWTQWDCGMQWEWQQYEGGRGPAGRVWVCCCTV